MSIRNNFCHFVCYLRSIWYWSGLCIILLIANETHCSKNNTLALVFKPYHVVVILSHTKVMWTKEVLCSNMKAGSTIVNKLRHCRSRVFTFKLHMFTYGCQYWYSLLSTVSFKHWKRLHGVLFYYYSLLNILTFGRMKEIFQISYIKLFKIKPFDNIIVRTRIIFVQQNWSSLNKPFNDRLGFKKHKNVEVIRGLFIT